MKYYLTSCIFEFNGDLNYLSNWKIFSTNALYDEKNVYSEASFQLYNLSEINERTTEEKIYSQCIPRLIENNTLHFHSSFIIYQNRAILFTGPSGIGKTTQAELWQKYRGAVIVNGDVSLIHKTAGKYYAYGCPLHGSSPYCENMTAPVFAIIVLEQAEKNEFSRLGIFDAVSSCIPEFHRPKMEPKTEEILWETISDFLSEIPVFRLCCRPDEEAVNLVEQKLFQ